MGVKKFISIFMIVVMTAISLSGCKSKETIKNVQEPDKEPYLNVFLDENPKTLDPSKGSDIYSSQILLETNEGLTRINENSNGKYELSAAGAEKWSVSEDGLTWTFYLRDNKWSDGKKIIASDYEYGIKRSLEYKVNSRYAYLLYPIKGAKEFNKGNIFSSNSVGVKALDDKTLQISLDTPCSYFLKLTYLKIMQPQRKDIVEKFKDKYGTSPETMVYSGPFILKKWENNNRIELEKNESYWDANSVKLKKVIFRIKNNNSSRFKELSNKSLDIAVVNNVNLKEELDKVDSFDKITVPTSIMNFDFFNEKNKLFSNAKVRKAFILAVNREAACKDIWKEMYSPAYFWVSPSINIDNINFREKANSNPIKKLKENNSNSKKLLIEGLEELGFDKDPSRLTITYLQPANDSRQKELAEFFKDMYSEKLGVNIKLEYLPWEDFKKRIDLGRYEFASATWNSDYDDPIGNFDLWIKGMELFPTGWTNDKYYKLMKEAYNTEYKKIDERVEKFKAAENMLLYEDAVLSPISYKNKFIYKQKYVKGIFNTNFDSEIEFKYAYTMGR